MIESPASATLSSPKPPTAAAAASQVVPVVSMAGANSVNGRKLHQQQHHQQQQQQRLGNKNRKKYLNTSSSSSSSSSNASTLVPADATAETTNGTSDATRIKKSKSRNVANTANNMNHATHLNSNKQPNKAESAKTGGGSKKTNLNHLLNFTYESYRDSRENYYEYEKLTKQFWSMKLSKNSYFSKEQFLQANCQFVVKNSCDYSVHLSDPDLLVDWEKIEEIHIGSNESLVCPICLYAPQAGKMTKCGHVYCWSCILHYLALSDKTWRKCPICYESIYKKDLKSAKVIEQTNEFKIGDTIELDLMFKPKNSKYSAISLPMSVYEQFVTSEKAPTFSMFNKPAYADARKFIKLHTTNDVDIYEKIIKRERDELQRQLENEKDQPEVCFVSEALDLLAEREKLLKVSRATVTEASVASKPVDAAGLEKEEKTTGEKKTMSPDDLSYFYQSSDGRRVFISGLNMRCLVHEHESCQALPKTIHGNIVAIDSFFMTDENRKRFRYLSHLPLHSEFQVVELEFKEPLFSKSTLEHFKHEIDERRQVRSRKELKEKRLADKMAASIAASTIQPSYYVPSATTTTNTNENANNYANEFPEASSPTFSSCGNSNTSVSDSSNSASSQQQQQNFSFAQMLRNKSSSTGYDKSSNSTKMINDLDWWPTLDAPGSQSVTKPDENIVLPTSLSSSTTKTSGWLTTLSSREEMGRTRKYQPAPFVTEPRLSWTNDEDQEEESMPAPLYKASFFSAFDASFKHVDSKKLLTNPFDVKETMENNELTSLDENSATKNLKSKKKKKSKQLLFST